MRSGTWRRRSSGVSHDPDSLENPFSEACIQPRKLANLSDGMSFSSRYLPFWQCLAAVAPLLIAAAGPPSLRAQDKVETATEALALAPPGDWSNASPLNKRPIGTVPQTGTFDFTVRLWPGEVELSGAVRTARIAEGMIATIGRLLPGAKIWGQELEIDPAAPPLPPAGELEGLLMEMMDSTRNGKIRIGADTLVISGLTDNEVAWTALQVRIERISEKGWARVENRIRLMPTEDLIQPSLRYGKKESPTVSPEVELRVATREDESDFEFSPDDFNQAVRVSGRLSPGSARLFDRLRLVRDHPEARSKAYRELANDFGAEVKLQVSFSSSSAGLAKGDVFRISKLAEEAGDQSRFLVIGYASIDGREETNRELAIERASTVAGVIADARSGIQIEGVYFGPTRRFDLNRLRPNRVVEIWHVR